MKLFRLFAPALIAILFSMSVKAQQKATDFLSIPEYVQFNNASWKLNWSSHPNANYYKQEYLTSGEQTDKYKNADDRLYRWQLRCKRYRRSKTE